MFLKSFFAFFFSVQKYINKVIYFLSGIHSLRKDNCAILDIILLLAI